MYMDLLILHMGGESHDWQVQLVRVHISLYIHTARLGIQINNAFESGTEQTINTVNPHQNDHLYSILLRHQDAR